MTHKNSVVRLMHIAAVELKQDGVLPDPTNYEILLACAELQGLAPVVLERLTAIEKDRIITTYDLTKEQV